MTAYQLQIGDIECAVLQEGQSAMTLDELAGRYPDVSRQEIAAALAGEVPSGSLNLLYIKSGETRILADVGFGEAGPSGTGGTVKALDSLGVAPADIDILFLTHFHGDHIAGFFDAEGAPVYHKARFVTAQAEWEEWMGRWGASDSAGDQLNLERFSSLQDRFSFVEDGDELAPGVSVVDMVGHTQGHSGLLVEAGGDRLLHVVDILHQPFQFARTDWRFSFDSDADLAMQTRRRILQRCADEGLLTFFYHLPFPGLGRVSAEGDSFVWNPTT